MLKSKYKQMKPKTITHRSYKNFSEEKFKEAIRLFLHCGWQLNFSSTCNWKKARSICSNEKDVLRGNNKPHMTSQLRKAIMKRSRLKNKANTSGKPDDKAAYKTQRNLVVKWTKRAKKCFLKNHITENATKKTKFFWKLCKPFFTEDFHYKQESTLKTKRGVSSSEISIANI